MNVLLYANQAHAAGQRLKKVIETLVSNNQKEICPSVEELARRLRRPLGGQFLGVLLAADQQELSDFLSIRDLLRDVRFILILPDRKKNTVSKGFTLRPRFISYADEDFMDVAAVMCKMITNISHFITPSEHMQIYPGRLD